MLKYNGRSGWGAGKLPPEFTRVSAELKKLWEEKGSETDFYEKYYLPKWGELTKGLLP